MMSNGTCKTDWCDNIVQVANTRVPAVSAQLLVNGAFRDMTKVSGRFMHAFGDCMLLRIEDLCHL
jgi:hypothetical protein